MLVLSTLCFFIASPCRSITQRKSAKTAFKSTENTKKKKRKYFRISPVGVSRLPTNTKWISNHYDDNRAQTVCLINNAQWLMMYAISIDEAPFAYLSHLPTSIRLLPTNAHHWIRFSTNIHFIPLCVRRHTERHDKKERNCLDDHQA